MLNVGRLDHGNETLCETHECCTAEPASYKRMLSYKSDQTPLALRNVQLALSGGKELEQARLAQHSMHLVDGESCST